MISLVPTPKSSSQEKCYIMLDINECQPQPENNEEFDDVYSSLYDQIATSALPPYRPILRDDDPIKPTTFYTCRICDDRYITKSNLDYHMNRRSIQIKYYCQNCDRVIIDFNRCSFLNHLQEHVDAGGYQSDALRVSVLPLSDEQFLTNQYKQQTQGYNLGTAVKATTSTHETNERESPSEVPRNTSAISGRAHQRDVAKVADSNTSKSYSVLVTGETCKECGMKLLCDLRNHFLRPNCVVNPMYECKECNLILPSPCSFRAHLRFHEKVEPYTCPECGLSFSLWATFLVHLNFSCFHLSRCMHYKCPQCACVFSSVELFEIHFKFEHVKTVFKCDECPVACFDTISADYHKSHVHKQKEVQYFQYQQCQLCPDHLMSEELVAPHILEHSQDKKILVLGFKCSTCKKLFQGKGALGAHQCPGSDVNKTNCKAPLTVNSVSLANTTTSKGENKTTSDGFNRTNSGNDFATTYTPIIPSISNNNVKCRDENKSATDNAISVPHVSVNNSGINNSFSQRTYITIPENIFKNESLKLLQGNTQTKYLPVKILTRTFPISKLMSQKLVQSKSIQQTEKPILKQYINNKIHNIVPKTNGNKALTSKKITLTQDLMKNTFVKSISPVHIKGPDKNIIKVHKVNKSCSVCKSDVTFHVPSLHQVSKLPSKCYNCMRKVSTCTGTSHHPVLKPKAIITLQNANIRKSVVSCATTITTSVTSSTTSTVSTAKIPLTDTSRGLDPAANKKIEETKESARFAFNGPHTGDSITRRGQFKCHLCHKLLKIQPNEIQEHFVREHKNIEIRKLTPRLKKINIEHSQTSIESGARIKVEPEDEASTENPSSMSAEEKNEASEPPRKKKKTKVASKEKPSTPPIPFSSGKLIFPVIKKEDNRYECFKCGFTHTNKSDFETHVLSHKTESSSFQCMECGMCFIVQPSFEKHLFVCHGIKDVEKYVRENQNCKEDSYDPYNGYSPVSVTSDEDADDNKCSVCHESFETSEELDKHFRVHGMAFLLKKQRELRQIIRS